MDDLCDVFNVTLDYLLDESDDSVPTSVPTGLAEYTKIDEMLSIQNLAITLTCFSEQSKKIMAATIAVAYKIDKQTEQL